MLRRALDRRSHRVTSPVEQFDWRVVLDYQFTDDVMAYVQVSTGYKGGGINPRPFYREPGACRSIRRR